MTPAVRSRAVDCSAKLTPTHALCRYRLVKAWAAAHGLNDAAANTLNSWSLGLLVAFYLQVCISSETVTESARMLPMYSHIFSG
jgi:hypothetical protein